MGGKGGRGLFFLSFLGFCAMHCATIVFLLLFFPLPRLHFLLKGVWETVVRWVFFHKCSCAMVHTGNIGRKGFTIVWKKKTCKNTYYSPYFCTDVPIPLPEAKKSQNRREKTTFLFQENRQGRNLHEFSLFFFSFSWGNLWVQFSFPLFPPQKGKTSSSLYFPNKKRPTFLGFCHHFISLHHH